jgi:cytochrome c oxidase assembly factor CtaG
MSHNVHAGLYWGPLPILVTGALIVVVIVYLRGWYELRSSLPNVLSGWRLASFMSGAFSLWAATNSPLAALDHQFLTAHMMQHLLLMTVAAPLILLGAPVIALLHGIPQRLGLRALGQFLRCPFLHGAGRILTHPVFCWFVSTATVIGWHVPGLFEIGIRSARWHAAEHADFFAAGLLFWWPVVRPWPSLANWPRWFVPLYLFLATLPCDALSAFLTFCNRVVYPHYLSVHRLFDFSPLADQESAGALMWVWVTFVYLAPAAVVTIQMLSPPSQSMRAEVV